MKIFIVRHGESEGNIRATPNNEYVIDSEIALTNKGEHQAYVSGNFLKMRLDKYGINTGNVEMWVSPFKRTRKTAELMNKSLMIPYQNVREDPRIAEQDFGDFDYYYMPYWQYISPHSHYINTLRYESESGRFFARLENGENLADVYNRISIFVETRLLKNDKNKIIVTHGNSGRVLAMYLLDEKIEWIYHDKVPSNASIREFEYDKNLEKWKENGYILK